MAASSLKITSYKTSHFCSYSCAPTTVHVHLQGGGNKITLEVEESFMHTIGWIKDEIAEKMNIPRIHQRLKIAAKPNVVLCEFDRISKYDEYNLHLLDLVVEVIPGDCYIRVLSIEGSRSEFESTVNEPYSVRNSFIIKVNNVDIIKTVRDQIAEKNPPNHSSSKEGSLFYKSAVPKDLSCNETELITFEKWHKQHYGMFAIDLTTAAYQKLYDDHILHNYRVAYFHQLLKFKICSLNTGTGSKHVYSVQISDDMSNSDLSPTKYLLSVEYSTTVKQLYSMVADYYKVAAEDVVLMVNNCQIADNGTQLHEVFYSPIILYREIVYECHSALGYPSEILSKFKDCRDPAQCEIATNVRNGLIIKEMVAVRNDTWEVIIKAFNISDEVKKEIAENSEDDLIRCMDVIHRMYHHDEDLTWEFIVTHLERQDPQLADVIKEHL